MSTGPYLREGSGETLVLLHGVGSSAQVWQPMLAGLSRHRDVIALTLPGFDNTPLGDLRPTVQGYADHVERVLDELGLEAPHLGGHSLGGAVALELGRRGLARSVVAFAPIGFWRAAGALWARDVLRAMAALTPRLRPLLPSVIRTGPGRITAFILFYGQPAGVPQDVLLASADAFTAGEAVTAAVGAFTGQVFSDAGLLASTPTTIVWGSRDLILPARTQARRARKLLPHADHVLLRRCGHVPFDDPFSCELLLVGQCRQPRPIPSTGSNVEPVILRRAS